MERFKNNKGISDHNRMGDTHSLVTKKRYGRSKTITRRYQQIGINHQQNSKLVIRIRNHPSLHQAKRNETQPHIHTVVFKLKRDGKTDRKEGKH